MLVARSLLSADRLRWRYQVNSGVGIPSDTGGMTEPPISYKRHRFPPQIIAQAVWLYFRFPLSLRLVEELLLELGIVVSYETVRI